MSLRVVTWNIHGCVGTDRVFDPERTARVVRSMEPDILALQEVDTRRRHKNVADVFESLQSTVRGHALHAWSLSTQDGHYGQMLISRWPLLQTRVHDISVEGREPRRAMEARVDSPGGPLRVIATHLGVRPRERWRQFQKLDRIARARDDEPCILVGDLNELRRSGRGSSLLAGVFGAATPQRTYPSQLPLWPLDRIWCRPAELLISSRTETSARLASDHLPVVAQLALDSQLKYPREPSCPAAVKSGEG